MRALSEAFQPALVAAVHLPCEALPHRVHNPCLSHRDPIEHQTGSNRNSSSPTV